jgi:hypothetical protein
MEANGVPVQHEGEYVLTKDGSKDFGEITAETGLQPGKIRLRIGREDEDKGDYGEKHIERPIRLAQLRQNGYTNARDLVEEVAKGYDSIYPGKGNGLILARRPEEKDKTIYVELKPVENDQFYDVTSALISKKSYLKNKRPLWERPQERPLQQ